MSRVEILPRAVKQQGDAFPTKAPQRNRLARAARTAADLKAGNILKEFRKVGRTLFFKRFKNNGAGQPRIIKVRQLGLSGRYDNHVAGFALRCQVVGHSRRGQRKGADAGCEERSQAAARIGEKCHCCTTLLKTVRICEFHAARHLRLQVRVCRNIHAIMTTDRREQSSVPFAPLPYQLNIDRP